MSEIPVPSSSLSQTSLYKQLSLSRRDELHTAIRQAIALWNKPRHATFTDHQPQGHSERVVRKLDALVKQITDSSGYLNDAEAFVVLTAAYLHDVGMQNQIPEHGDDAAVRANHHLISQEMIINSVQDPTSEYQFGLRPDLAEEVALVSSAHRKLDLRDARFDERPKGEHVIRLRFLGALLRFADSLDMDSERVDMQLLRVARLEQTSRLHWWRCHYVSAVQIASGSIRVYCEMPDESYASVLRASLYREVRTEWMNVLPFLHPLIRLHIEEVNTRIAPLKQRMLTEDFDVLREDTLRQLEQDAQANSEQIAQLRIGDDENVTRSHKSIEESDEITTNNAVASQSPSQMFHALLPPRPQLIVGREQDLHELKARLGVHSSAANSLTTQVVTTVRGWPGVGKTTLIAELAHDVDISKKFSDGILWTALGEKPDLRTNLDSWLDALGISCPTSYKFEMARNRLIARLQGLKMLLLVDDVWEPEHARAFEFAVPGCALLIATREKRVADRFTGTPDQIYWLDVLTDGKAQELMQNLAPAVCAKYPELIEKLLLALEGLPLAIQVAGRLLNTEANMGASVEALVDELSEETKLLEAQAPNDLSDLLTYTTPTVAALLRKSTDRLDDLTRYRFLRLAPFAPKPASFDLSVLRRIWKCEDPFPTIRNLIERGLMEPIQLTKDLRLLERNSITDQETVTWYQMHSLLVLHAKSMSSTNH